MKHQSGAREMLGVEEKMDRDMMVCGVLAGGEVEGAVGGLEQYVRLRAC